MDEVIELVNVKFSVEGFSPDNFYFKASVVEVVLVFTDESFLLVEFVSSFRVDVKFQLMPHPLHLPFLVFDVFELPREGVELIEEVGVGLLLLFFLHELVPHPFSS